jgi:hypothetical protein
MAIQLIIGSILIVTTIMIHSAFIGLAASTAEKNSQWLRTGDHSFKTTLAVTIVVLWMLTSISICTWMWAGLFIWIDVFNSLEPAIYFSLVTMTTLGFGDIILDPQWRILSGLTAVNGLLLFGLTTAFLVEFIFQVRKSQK